LKCPPKGESGLPAVVFQVRCDNPCRQAAWIVASVFDRYRACFRKGGCRMKIRGLLTWAAITSTLALLPAVAESAQIGRDSLSDKYFMAVTMRSKATGDCLVKNQIKTLDVVCQNKTRELSKNFQNTRQSPQQASILNRTALDLDIPATPQTNYADAVICHVALSYQDREAHQRYSRQWLATAQADGRSLGRTPADISRDIGTARQRYHGDIWLDDDSEVTPNRSNSRLFRDIGTCYFASEEMEAMR
jgi:hypothetical protein